jgi:multiple sugar transport system permease protein
LLAARKIKGAIMTSVAIPHEEPVGSNKKWVRRILTVAGMLFLIILALVETVPFVLTVANSLKCLPAVQSSPQAVIPVPPFGVECTVASGASRPASETSTALTFNPTLDGYRNVLQANNLPRWFLNSIIYSVGVTLLRVLFDSLAGYALARMKFPGNRALFNLMLGTMMIPGIVLLIPRFIILQQLGMLNSYQGFILSLAADAFGVFLMKQFFESIPAEIEEAAMVDGANRFVMFFRVILPMATPALTALIIFSFQGTWNNFMDALIVIGGNADLLNLPLGLALLRGAEGRTLVWNTFLAGSVLTTLPLAVLFFMFQRYFVEGANYSGLAGT